MNVAYKGDGESHTWGIAVGAFHLTLHKCMLIQGARY